MSRDRSAPVLVTGATGFLGGQVVARLVQEGSPVVAQGRDAAKLAKLARQSGVTRLQWDLSQPIGRIAVPDFRAVIHCAALSAPFGGFAAFHQANVLGTQHVLDLAEAKQVARLVHISTPSVYFALQDQLDVREDMALPPPFNAYAATKAQAEQLVQANARVASIILRPRGIYGPGDETLLPRLLRAARARPLPLFRGGAGRIDLTFVDDVVDAILAALHAPDGAVGAVYNISGGEVLPIRDIVEQVCTAQRVPVRWRAMPLRPALAVAGGLEWVHQHLLNGREPAVTRYALALFAFAQSLDISKARDGLGWTPKVRFADGLARVMHA